MGFDILKCNLQVCLSTRMENVLPNGNFYYLYLYLYLYNVKKCIYTYIVRALEVLGWCVHICLKWWVQEPMLLWLLVASFWGFTRAIPYTKWRPWKFLVVTRIFLLQLLKRFSFIFSCSSSCYYVVHCPESIVMTLLSRSWIVSHLLSTKFLYCRRKKRLTLWVYWSRWNQPLVFTSLTIQIWLWSKLMPLRIFPAYYERRLLLLVQFLSCLCIQCPCLAFDCGGGFKRSQKGPRLLLSQVLIWRGVGG